MLNELLDLIRPVFISDPVFGRLRFQRVGFWEGSIVFPPGGATVEVLLDGGVGGPIEEQRSFLRVLTEKYPSLWPKVEVALERSLVDWQPDGKQEYRLVAIDIPLTALSGQECHLGYEAAPSGLHLDVEIQGWTVGDVAVEC